LTAISGQLSAVSKSSHEALLIAGADCGRRNDGEGKVGLSCILGAVSLLKADC
jgi:hypothetical protein